MKATNCGDHRLGEFTTKFCCGERSWPWRDSDERLNLESISKKLVPIGPAEYQEVE